MEIHDIARVSRISYISRISRISCVSRVSRPLIIYWWCWVLFDSEYHQVPNFSRLFISRLLTAHRTDAPVKTLDAPSRLSPSGGMKITPVCLWHCSTPPPLAFFFFSYFMTLFIHLFISEEKGAVISTFGRLPLSWCPNTHRLFLAVRRDLITWSPTGHKTQGKQLHDKNSAVNISPSPLVLFLLSL